MTLHIDLSPCPNDTFAFEALINQRVDTEGLDFEVDFHDIRQLNSMLLDPARRTDVSKCSYAVMPEIIDRYALIDSGSALGHGNGPLWVAARDFDHGEFAALSVAIPGENTTANMLMNRLFGQVTDKREILFSDIAGAILAGEVQTGVLIHESRFTYREHGLHLLADLGAEWEARTGLPLPLGAIVVSRALGVALRRKIERVARRSVEYALANPSVSREFVKSHAQELDNEVIDKHISMFVNHFTVSLGEDGRRAVTGLLGLRGCLE
jgi:1,4-dihydroxy-6-naphthoate synthase